MNKKYSILIPAYNPDSKLLKLISKLTFSEVENIVVINDGSKSKSIFEKIKNKKVKILHHCTNLGKGSALKTGLNYLCVHSKSSIGFVTADADGQHLPEDIRKIGQSLLKKKNCLVLGIRLFDKKTPLRSKFGNYLTKIFFYLITRLNIKDTQTGLRGIPKEMVEQYLKINSNGYDFEIDMLLKTKKTSHSIVQVPIKTVYIDENKSSHFNPILDSMKIYFVLFRFIISSCLAALIDFLFFAIFFLNFKNIAFSQFGARIISCTFNFLINKKNVFRSNVSNLSAVVKYISLAIFLLVSSYSLIIAITHYFLINVFYAKILAETFLFIVSFIIQKTIIFKKL